MFKKNMEVPNSTAPSAPAEAEGLVEKLEEIGELKAKEFEVLDSPWKARAGTAESERDALESALEEIATYDDGAGAGLAYAAKQALAKTQGGSVMANLGQWIVSSLVFILFLAVVVFLVMFPITLSFLFFSIVTVMIIAAIKENIYDNG